MASGEKSRQVPASGVRPKARQVVPIDPRELEVALAADEQEKP